MRLLPAFTAALVVATTNATSLRDVCTTSYAQTALPADGTLLGTSVDTSSVAVTANYNVYGHIGRNDTVALTYWMPAPTDFQNRFLTTGGEAYNINEGTSSSGSLPGGVMYGAVSGLTDGGFNGQSFDDVFLIANGTIDWQNTFMMGYQGIYEMMILGREFTKNFYDTADKVYTYYQSCSEGGREGWSQAQRYGAEYDGIIVGAPAFRFAQQQINHLTSNVVEKTVGYYPPPCELELIVNATINACDPLDGKTDGVIARSDLCKLNFNISSLIGAPYYCAASSSGGGIGLGFSKRQMGGGLTTPAQNGTVTELGVKVAQTILDGLKDSQGRQAYLSYQPGADFDDAETKYDSTSDTWGLSIDGNGGEFVSKFIELLDISSITTLDNVTYDTLRDWMYTGWTRYQDSLQVNNPDLTEIALGGGKIIHFHGESDPSVPTASSVHYRESVRQIMYPGMSLNESSEALNEFYRLYLVPGAAHCGVNREQPNGPFPQTNLAAMIDWVENGVEPVLLDATVLSGDNKGQTGKLCSWPLRPLWTNNATKMDCVFDQASYDTWVYNFTAYALPLY
ncbi:Tannase/feruloyl esterase [Coniella lustricola]|uniref:Carboxylic ester hydrolase n=1 Tax=Coniella lustricola TaxID=2025994 RepID=A0A2T3A4N2_9PEZI|nr:Tannase/feruloyl esterase [Coniella lustricola]